MAATLPNMFKSGAQTAGQNTPSGANAPTLGLFSALSKNLNIKKPTGLPLIGDDNNSPSKAILRNLSSFNNGADGGNNKIEQILNMGLKKKMGMDYISEKSGLDMRKFTAEYIRYKLDKYKTRTKKT